MPSASDRYLCGQDHVTSGPEFLPRGAFKSVHVVPVFPKRTSTLAVHSEMKTGDICFNVLGGSNSNFSYWNILEL